MSKVGVPGRNEAMDEGTQSLGGADTRAAQAFATQDREPNLDLVEPRAMSRQPVEGNLGPLGRAPVQHGLFLMIAGVVHNQMPTAIGVASPQGPQEMAKLQVGMPLIALGKDFPRPDIKGSKEIDGPMADILKLLAFDQPRTQRQRGVQALQGLEVGLLIKAENPTAPGGMQVELENLGHLLFKPRVSPGQEIAQAMGFEHQRRQNPLHGGRTHSQNLPPPGDQPRQIADAVVRKAPKLPFLGSLAGDGDDRVPGQRGKNPVGDPTGANPARRRGELPAHLPPLLSAAAVHTGQSACATSAPNSVTFPPGPQSLDWTAPLAPARECSPAAPSVAAFSRLAADLLRLAVQRHLTEFHSGARAYAPLPKERYSQYTANELGRHGTRVRVPRPHRCHNEVLVVGGSPLCRPPRPPRQLRY